ncbi:MAG: GntR family transcriptional regulator [Cypionkella sp.]
MSTIEQAGAARAKDVKLTADRVLEYIRGLLASGQLSSGDRLNEAEIAMSLGISRGPVREAIMRLSSSGLLVTVANVGSRIVSLNETAALALYEVREALESLSARLAAERMTAGERRQLSEMLASHVEAMDSNEMDAYPSGSSDWDFHLAILKGARNEVAWRVCGNDLRDLLTLLRAQHGKSKGRGRRALEEHLWISQAIARGEADLAGLLMAQHIRASRDTLLGLMRGENTERTGPA